MKSEFINKVFLSYKLAKPNPQPESIYEILNEYLKLMFPELSEKQYGNIEEVEARYKELHLQLLSTFQSMQRYLPKKAEVITNGFLDYLPGIFDKLKSDVEAIVVGDPAATSAYEVIRAYPGFYAIAMYRMANVLFKMSIPVLARIITEFAHSKTGIDIHPGAEIGSHFCIDHGTGIVIGETSVIGSHVKIYQGVTLGALSVNKSMASKKRHPTIEDHVVIYAGATILGADTIIGHHSIVGGNVWLTKTVPPFSTVYHKAQIEIGKLEDIKGLPGY
ncbi:MAG: serine acetyltransferase [Sporocytophaga sp.]|nr:serine acetyltransferase [Sporocytophaga sp.]